MRCLILVGCAGCSFELPGATPTDGKLPDVPLEAQSDTPMIDAEVFDPGMCPAEYANAGITASPNSRYRLINNQAPFATHHADCNDDRVGWTHLVVLDTPDEAQQVRAIITSATYYAGAVQPQSSGSPSAGWLLFTGNTMSTALWQNNQPNDNNNGGENNEQNLAAADDQTGLLNDVSGSSDYRAVCECDGLAIPTSVSTIIPP